MYYPTQSFYIEPGLTVALDTIVYRDPSLLITALGGYYVSGSDLLIVDDEGIITNVQPWCNTTTTTTTTTTAPPCSLTFNSNFSPLQSGPGTLTTSSTEIKINAQNANNSQTSVATGTITIASGCENTDLTYQVYLANEMNQTGSVSISIAGLAGQTGYSDTLERKGIGANTGTITISQTGSYQVTLTGTFGSISANVSSTSYVRMYP